MNLKKLFDENNEFESDFFRTIWYGYVVGELDDNLVDTIVCLVLRDLKAPPENRPLATHWVFYASELMDDALGEKVRSSLMIREFDGKFAVNYNFSDFSFVSRYDTVMEFSQKVLSRLYKSLKS